jgi:hypothetical protein
MVQRQRMTRGALFTVGSDDGDFSDLFGRPHQAVEAVGKDAIVVRAEEAHQGGQ